VGAGWDSNIDFQVPDGPSSWTVSPRGNLSRVFWGAKGQLLIGGTGDWVGYPDQEDLSTYSVTFSVDGSYRSSRTTTWRANGIYGLGYSDSSFVLAAQGVLLPLVKTRTLAGALGVTRKVGLKTSFRLDGRIYRTVFDQDAAEVSALADGQSIRGTAALERMRGQRDTVALEYSLESSLGQALPGAVGDERPHHLTHYGSLQWTHILSPTSGFLLEAGGSYTPDAEEAGLGQQASFYGGASYSREVKSSSLTVFARREVTPAFGLGFSRLESRFGLSATIAMGSAWTLRLNGHHVQPETPEGAPATYATPDEAFVTLGRRIGRALEISTEARYRRRGSTSTFPAIDEFRAGVYLSLLSPTGSSTAPAVGR
jgi:hypothetical protein